MIGGGSLGPEWAGLVGAWEYDGNDAASLIDASGNGHDFTSAGTQATQQTGLVNESRYALSSGSSQYTTAADSAFAQGASYPWTILTWVYPDAVSQYVGVWEVRNSGGTGQNTYLYHHTNTNWYINWTGGSFTFSPSSLTSQWYMLMVKFDTTNIYASVNDGSVTSSAVGGWTDTANCYFRTFFTSFTTGSCRLDMSRYFNRALSEEEITAHYNGGAGLAYPA
jgi:hypothetical protein